MNDSLPDHRTLIGCGIVDGFHKHTNVPLIVQMRPEQRGQWLLPGEPPVKGQRVKVQVWMETGDWGILTGRITEIGDGFVIAIAVRTTDDETVPGGPYLLTLRYNETMEFPWVLTHAEFTDYKKWDQRT